MSRIAIYYALFKDYSIGFMNLIMLLSLLIVSVFFIQTVSSFYISYHKQTSGFIPYQAIFLQQQSQAKIEQFIKQYQPKDYQQGLYLRTEATLQTKGQNNTATLPITLLAMSYKPNHLLIDHQRCQIERFERILKRFFILVKGCELSIKKGIVTLSNSVAQFEATISATFGGSYKIRPIDNNAFNAFVIQLLSSHNNIHHLGIPPPLQIVYSGEPKSRFDIYYAKAVKDYLNMIYAPYRDGTPSMLSKSLYFQVSSLHRHSAILAQLQFRGDQPPQPLMVYNFFHSEVTIPFLNHIVLYSDRWLNDKNRDYRPFLFLYDNAIDKQIITTHFADDLILSQQANTKGIMMVTWLLSIMLFLSIIALLLYAQKKFYTLFHKELRLLKIYGTKLPIYTIFSGVILSISIALAYGINTLMLHTLNGDIVSYFYPPVMVTLPFYTYALATLVWLMTLLWREQKVAKGLTW